MMLTLISVAIGLSLSAKSMKILFDRCLEERKYHAIDPDRTAEDFLTGRI